MSITKNIPISSVQIQQVALLSVQLCTPKQVAERLGLTQAQVRAALETEECKQAVAGLADAAFEAARSYLRREIPKLAHEVVRVLREQLEEKNSLEAVKISLKVMGLDEAEGDKPDTNITVIMPTEKVIEVESGDPV